MLHQMPFMKTQENLNKNVNENRFYTNTVKPRSFEVPGTVGILSNNR